MNFLRFVKLFSTDFFRDKNKRLENTTPKQGRGKDLVSSVSASNECFTPNDEHTKR